MDKYRAWDESINYLDYRVRLTTTEDYIKVEVLDSFTSWRELEENRYKLMRATGIKDKNNKDIYEGDILHWIDKSEKSDGSLEDTLIVYWSDDFLAWVVVGKEWIEDTEVQYLFEYNNPRELEVIGNIYEGVQ